MDLRALATLAALALAPPSAHALLGTEIGVRGTYWVPTLSGDMSVDDTPMFDVEDDLDFDDGMEQGIPGGEVFLRLGDHHLSVAGYRVDYSGTHDTSLEYTQLEATYQWDLIDLENWIAGTSFGPVLQAKYLEGDAEIGSSESFKLIVPMVGLGGHVGILKDYLEARFRGLWVGYQGNQAVDAFGEIGLTLFPFVDLSAGYRYIKVDLDASDLPGSSGDFVLDVTQAGPYVSLCVQFGL